jgi:hypothetical protein
VRSGLRRHMPLSSGEKSLSVAVVGGASTCKTILRASCLSRYLSRDHAAVPPSLPFGKPWARGITPPTPKRIPYEIQQSWMQANFLIIS